MLCCKPTYFVLEVSGSLLLWNVVFQNHQYENQRVNKYIFHFMFKFSFVVMKFIVYYMIGKCCVIELHPKLLRV